MGDTVLLDPALAEALAAAGLDTVDGLLALGGDALPASVVAPVTAPVAGTAGRFHLKRYVYETWGRSWGLLGRGTGWGEAPELREFRVLAGLREHGIPAARPVIAAARRRGPRLAFQALLTEHVPAAIDLSTRLGRDGDPVRREPEIRRRVLASIAEHLARMHAAGLVHAHVHARNVLVGLPGVEGPSAGDIGVVFLDCRRGGAPARGRQPLLDLATLDGDLAGRVPATDRLRALIAYLPEGQSRRGAVQRITRVRERLRRSALRRGQVRR